jgi:uncharacterized protein YbjT (DUF2867 family)
MNLMHSRKFELLVAGGTGSVGQLVVEEAVRRGHHVRVLTRDPDRYHGPADVDVIQANLTKPDTLRQAMRGVDGVVFAHGTYRGDGATAKAVDYGGVANVMAALEGRSARIVLLTTMGVTHRHERSDWLRRAERLVRASSNPYTVIRPGYFDYHDAGQFRLVMLQGDRRHFSTPADGAVSRRQVAQVAVHCLTSLSGERKTFELIAEQGDTTTDLEQLLSELDTDRLGYVDGIHDADNMPG